MAKLKLNKKEVKTVKDSIKHWKRDIQAKLKKGIKIIEDTNIFLLNKFIWADNGKKVRCFSDDCPLCAIYILDNCILCPYFLKYGARCDTVHWRSFTKNSCLKTCNGMIRSLENILK